MTSGEAFAELALRPPSDAVWDMDDPAAEPPWGTDISPSITDLSNYFVTSDGNDPLTVLGHALVKASEMVEDVVVRVLRCPSYGLHPALAALSVFAGQT